MNQRILIGCIVLATSLLSACHKNPLKTHSVEDSTRFLINASVAATKSMKWDMGEQASQRAYLNCMEGKAQGIDCSSLYQAMLQLAQEQRFASFKELTVADLCDKETFDSLREGYEERYFINNLEH